MAEEYSLQCRSCRLFVTPRLSWARGGRVNAICPHCGKLIDHPDPTGEILKRLGPRPAPKPAAEPATLFDPPAD